MIESIIAFGGDTSSCEAVGNVGIPPGGAE